MAPRMALLTCECVGRLKLNLPLDLCFLIENEKLSGETGLRLTS